MAGIGRRKARPGKLILDWRDGGGVRHYKEFPDTKAGEQEAQETLVRVRKQAQTGRVVPDEKVSIREYYEGWLKATSYALAYNTLKGRRSVFEVHVLPRFGAVPLVRLNRASIRTFLAELIDQGYQPSTVHNMLLNLGSLFAYAVDNGDLEMDPTNGLARRMGIRPNRDQVRAMTREQLGRFLAAVKEGSEYPAFALLAFSGMRIGEALAVQLADIDFGENTVRVERQMLESGAVTKPKSPQSKRTVEIPGSLVDLFRDRASLPRRGPWLLSPDWPLEVTWGPSGRRRGEIYAAMKEALSKAELPSTFTPHSLRHTFAALHLERNRPLLWVSRQLGHSSISITADRYGRWARPKGDGAADDLALSVEDQPVTQKVTSISK